MLKQTNQAIGNRQEAAGKSVVDLKTLHKALYVAAMECVVDRFKGDTNEIKSLRDTYTVKMFGRNYKDLTRDELLVAIDILNMKSSGQKPERASRSQLKLLRFYQIQCAFVYANWAVYIFKIDETCELLQGDELRNWVIKGYEKNERIDRSLYGWMHETWINPKSHMFLLEGGFKHCVKNAKSFHYEYLTPDEANYLIQRFGQMFVSLSKTGRFDFANNIGLN